MQFKQNTTSVRSIAMRAGISPAVVSAVLKGEFAKGRSIRYSEKTAQRVREIADEMGYVANRLTQSLIKQESFALGVLSPWPHHDRYSLIIRSLARCCQEEGYHLIVEPCGFSHEEFMMRLKALLALQVGAVVMIPPCSLHADLNVVMAEHRQKQSMFKNIFCADWFHQQLVFDCVEPDEQLMVELPLRHFHEKGHRYIGVIGDGTLPRRHSLAKVLDDLGMADTKELAMKGFVVKSDRSLCDDDVPELVRSMFHGKVKPTALYCWRDSFAAVAYRICEQEFGLRVGRDIALIGQDDTQLAQLLPTPITSLNHCDELLASQLFELIMDRLNGKLSATIQRKRIQSRLVVRQSTDYVVA